MFTTSTLTLTKDPRSMLAAMFSGRHALRQDDDGSYFIDRDSTRFRYVLNYLRDGGFRAGTLPADRCFLSELWTEAEYYQLTGLARLVADHINALATAATAAADDDDTTLTTTSAARLAQQGGASPRGARLQRKVSAHHTHK